MLMEKEGFCDYSRIINADNAEDLYGHVLL